MLTALQHLTALELFEQLQHTGIAVTHAASGQLHYANPTLCRWLGFSDGRLPPEVEGQSFNTLWALPPKVGSPFGQDKPVLLPHTAILQGHADATALKVKVKYHAVDATVLLVVMEPFSEDIALTSAHTDFVSTVSHEFRTPLTSIKGFADTLLRFGPNLPPDQSRRFINIIKDQADRLSRLVENLLSVSKVGAGRLEVSQRPVDLARLLERLIQTLQMKGGSDRHFEVVLADDLLPLWCDPDKLEQVLLNLLDNAVKYSGPGTTIRVMAEPVPEKPCHVLLRIQDQGIGIPKEHLPTIFTKFSRIDSPLTRTVEGTGLGLYITRSLTLAMQGTIQAESEAGQGTTFVLTFPLATAERQEAYRRKILVESADDEEPIAPDEADDRPYTPPSAVESLHSS